MRDHNEQRGDGAASIAWSVRSAAYPVAFSRTVGLFTPPLAEHAACNCAVLFLSPWGLEEMCTRRIWRELAERFAAKGIASLRFDYPGTGDSLDGAGLEGGLPVWEEVIVRAAGELRRLAGIDRLVLVGQGLGATLAVAMAGKLGNVAGAALLAPVSSGRVYLRELSVWSKMVDEGLGLRDEQRSKAAVSLAGLLMPASVATDLKAINVETATASPAFQIFVAERAAREKDAALSAHLASLGADVSRQDYAGYDDLVSNPTVARAPRDVMHGVVDWVAGVAAGTGGGASPIVPGTAAQEGDGFREEAVRFAGEGRMFGVLCQPIGQRRGATVVLLGTAYDRHAGWARSTVETARHLARRGIASLRFDAAGVADSPVFPGAPERELYKPRQRDDVKAAIDLVERRGLGPAVLFGRCSGAYLAFQGALHDVRCRGAVVINPFTFEWDDRETVDEVMHGKPRSLGDYKRRALSLHTARRFARGEVNLLHAARSIATQLGRRLLLQGPPVLSRLSKLGRLRATVHASFRRLAERKVPIALVYSGGDIGLDRFHFFFGLGGKGLKAYPNVRHELYEDADHNMTPPEAQAFMRERIEQVALAAVDAG